MPPDSTVNHSAASTRPRRASAAGLLRRAAAARPRATSAGRSCWLILAAGLEVLGPLLGKKLIDELPAAAPPRLDRAWRCCWRGVLLTGWAASWLRYLQLVRLSGLAMRSVQRLREWVYGHVLRLPMAFFDRAITGQLVSRVTNDTEAVKTLYIQVLFVILDSSIVLVGTIDRDGLAGLAPDADRAGAGAGGAGHRLAVPAPVGAGRHPRARAAQRHQRARWPNRSAA